MNCISKHLFLLLFATVLPACHSGNDFTDLGEAKDCDASRATCTVKKADMTVALTLGPDVVPLESFKVIATITGGAVDPNSVIVDYQMKGMDMGLNRYRLLASEGNWSGTATLPVCSASRMDWIALVEFSSDGKTYRAHFPFQTLAQP